MIAGLVASLALRSGLSPRVVRLALGIGAAVALAISATITWKLWLSSHDKQVAATHTLETDNAALRGKIIADEKAASQRVHDTQRLGQEAGALEGIHDASLSDTERRLARHRCLRAQQDARANGQPAPSCAGSGVQSGAPGAH